MVNWLALLDLMVVANQILWNPLSGFLDHPLLKKCVENPWSQLSLVVPTQDSLLEEPASSYFLTIPWDKHLMNGLNMLKFLLKELLKKKKALLTTLTILR